MKSSYISLGIALLGLTLSLAPIASAENITLTDGRLFKDATITAEDPIWVTISHSDGIIRVEKTLLPSELQKLHPSDPEKAASFATRYNAERAKLIEQQKAVELEAELDKASIPFIIIIQQVVEGGALGQMSTVAKVWVKDVKSMRYANTLLGRSGLNHTVDNSHWRDDHQDLGFGYVSGLSGVHDTQRWEGKAWKVGLYSYTNLQNWTRVVPKYTVDVHEALVALHLIEEPLTVPEANVQPLIGVPAVAGGVAQQGRITVQRATYGEGNSIVDVTRAVQEKVAAGKSSILSDTQLAGRDPSFGHVKELIVTYIDSFGQTKTITAREGSSADLR
jgi:hypothetical protein